MEESSAGQVLQQKLKKQMHGKGEVQVQKAGQEVEMEVAQVVVVAVEAIKL